jgi:iron complex transport system substrate-binding protein
MKKNHLFSIITAGMLTITLLAGCGNTGSNANADTGSNTNTVQESTEDQASAVPESEAQITGEGQNGETIIVTDVRGEVEIPAESSLRPYRLQAKLPVSADRHLQS